MAIIGNIPYFQTYPCCDFTMVFLFPRARTSTSRVKTISQVPPQEDGKKTHPAPTHCLPKGITSPPPLPGLEISMEYSYSAVPYSTWVIYHGNLILWPSTWWFLQNKPSGLSVALNAPDTMSRVTWHWLQPTGWNIDTVNYECYLVV